MKKERFIINIVGFENYNSSLEVNDIIQEKTSFEHLRKFASENCFFTSKNFKPKSNLIKNI